jgi:S-adenosylmethionine/arginine decarboxylase-like enzyme
MNDNQELNELKDEQIIKKFNTEGHWGLAVGIDLEKCNMDKIGDIDIIRDFAIGACDYIKMKRFGEPIIVKFESTPRLSGYSLMQLIQTSSITAHFKDFDGNAFIDVFSCKSYPPKALAMFCKKYFNAQKMTTRYITFRD